MPSYSVPTDPLDTALLTNHDQSKGQWVVIWILSSTLHAVYGTYKSWRLADRKERSLAGGGHVYWFDGTAYWHATP